MTAKQEKYLVKFADNLKDGIAYYQTVFTETKDSFVDTKTRILSELEESKIRLFQLKDKIEELVYVKA
jgi:hypothetical protein